MFVIYVAVYLNIQTPGLHFRKAATPIFPYLPGIHKPCITQLLLCYMILLLLLCAVVHPTTQDDKALPAVVSNWVPTTTILTFAVTNTSASDSTNNQTYTIKPTLGTLSLQITWSEEPDSNGDHLREVTDLKSDNSTTSTFNETEHDTECTFGDASWRIFRRLPEDQIWLLCDDQPFLSIPLSSYGISIFERMSVDLTALTGSYNLGNVHFSIRKERPLSKRYC